jgi:hypothetical protein
LLGAAVALVSVLACGNAHALGTPGEDHPYRSPQNAALEFRFGPYTANIDEGVTNKPYEKSFGTGPRVYTGLELDWQIYRIPGIGTIGPGFQVGRAAMTRKSAEVIGTYELTIYPVCLDFVIRVDQLWRRLGVPLMPYAKAGLGAGFWEVSTAFRKVLPKGTDTSGRSLGEMAAFGLAVPFDYFDADSSRGTDRAIGINTSSVYFEYDLLELNGFGAAHTLHVGDRTWVAGVMLEL